VLRYLLQLVPGVAAADSAALVVLENHKAKKLKVILEELERLGLDIPRERLESEDVLHTWLRVIRLAENAHLADKIRLFARVFRAFALKDGVDNVDDFEELVTPLRDMTVREFTLLAILRRFEERYYDKHPALTAAMRFWPEFEEAVREELKINPLEVTGYLDALTRTGLYCIFTGSAWDYEGGMGYTTPRLARLVQVVGDRSD